jgi:spermidine synthase
LLFFCSGLSGLIYQVVWVRVFGNVFGNTIYSASLVIAVFMFGLGVGSYVAGAWADRRYAASAAGLGGPSRAGVPVSGLHHPKDSLLRAYGYFELLIAAMGLGISALLPHLGQISALVSSYSRDASGWYSLSTASYLTRSGIAVLLLAPITLLMGGTLTLLIRHLVQRDLDIGRWRIAILYAANTAGAAGGCFLTDFALVPLWGFHGAQIVAVSFNLIAAIGAFWLASRPTSIPASASSPLVLNRRTGVSGATLRQAQDERLSVRAEPVEPQAGLAAVTLTSVALILTGFAAMGMEILWFRHFAILLGEFRAVFSLLLTVILIGIGAGSLASGFVHRYRGQPARWLIGVQGVFVASTLLGLAAADARSIEHVVMADPGYQAAAGAALSVESGMARSLAELWFNARPILLEVAVPALLMGFSFPLANAIVQRAELAVGHRAGALYLSNTIGAVCGALMTGLVLLPTIGMQLSATILMIAAGLTVVPLYLATTYAQDRFVEHRTRSRPAMAALGGALMLGVLVFVWWLQLPANYVIDRALALSSGNERVLAVSEGINEVIAVTEVPGKGRTLLTNGHPMSSTTVLSHRYMRALAHIPLLLIDDPQTALVIGFGVGNTAHAATLHSSMRRVEVAELSRDILIHSSYFKDSNNDVLTDPRVVAYLNDGRHHLQIQPPASYDLIALEPPPIAYAGVASLYSRDFYALARARLKPKGYLSQWLPAYQVPAATTLAMVRAFADVFPQTVLVSGAEADLLLIGANDSRIEIDPDRLHLRLSRDPAVQADLQRLDLGSVREIVGTFVASPQKLAEATRDATAVTDDYPIQEYGVRSLLNFGEAVPASLVDLSQVAAWCPKCFLNGKPVPVADGLDTYLALLDRAYSASPVEMQRTRILAERQGRVISGSAYLGAILPESADVHNMLGIALAEKGEFAEAISEFRQALRLEPDSASTHWNMGAALASHGAREEAIEHLRRAVQLDPNNGEARYDLASMLLAARQVEDAAEHFRATLRLIPNSVDAHNSLGIALASQGKLDEAIDQFQQALTLNPQSAEARYNLARALRQRRGSSPH